MYSWGDRLRDWANQRGAWTHILMGAGIAVLIFVIAMAACVPGKGTVSTNAANIAATQSTLSTIETSLGTKASKAQFDVLEEDVADALGDQAAGISDLDERATIAEAKLAQARTDITTIQGQIAEVINSPLTAALNGTFGDYTLSVKSDEAGNFTAKVHFVYSPAVGDAANYTEALGDFYASVNWSANATVPQYMAAPTSDGTMWGIGEVWWNIGVFALTADTEKHLDIICAGLDSSWEPTFVYVEVYRAW